MKHPAPVALWVTCSHMAVKYLLMTYIAPENKWHTVSHHFMHRLMQSSLQIACTYVRLQCQLWGPGPAQLSALCHGEVTFHFPTARWLPAVFHLPRPFSPGPNSRKRASFERQREKGSWRSEGLQLHLVFVWCRLTWGGRARGKRSMSINSSYITSLCWCQVAERKEKKESALTLFFGIVRPHLTLL